MKVLKKFISDAVSELHKVTWPTKKHAIRMSWITIGFVVICGVFIGSVDFILSTSYQAMLDLKHKNVVQPISDNSGNTIPVTASGLNTGSGIKIEGLNFTTGSNVPQ